MSTCVETPLYRTCTRHVLHKLTLWHASNAALETVSYIRVRKKIFWNAWGQSILTCIHLKTKTRSACILCFSNMWRSKRSVQEPSKSYNVDSWCDVETICNIISSGHDQVQNSQTWSDIRHETFGTTEAYSKRERQKLFNRAMKQSVLLNYLVVPEIIPNIFNAQNNIILMWSSKTGFE